MSSDPQIEPSTLPDSCPACGHFISIREGCGDSKLVGWKCMHCSAFSFARHEHPEITDGRKRASEYDGVHWHDERITRLPGRVQLGIMRERHRREMLDRE